MVAPEWRIVLLDEPSCLRERLRYRAELRLLVEQYAEPDAEEYGGKNGTIHGDWSIARGASTRHHRDGNRRCGLREHDIRQCATGTRANALLWRVRCARGESQHGG